MVTNRRRH